jgi:hypothetical protein
MFYKVLAMQGHGDVGRDRPNLRGRCPKHRAQNHIAPHCP